jgi:hypothetical protein
VIENDFHMMSEIAPDDQEKIVRKYSDDFMGELTLSNSEVVALLGDVKGTSVRLCLKRLNLINRTCETMKDITVINSKNEKSLETCILNFLKEFCGSDSDDDWPSTGVIGMPGEVS